MAPLRAPSRLPERLLALYVLCGLGALTWPGYKWAGRKIEPFYLGLPFSLFWVMAWILLTFLVVGLYHLVRGRGEA